MNIRTKVIGGYILFVVIVLSYLGVNHLISASAVREASLIYDVSEDIRLELEAENIFWRQVIASTDYFLTGDEEHKLAFRAREKDFWSRLELVEGSSDGDAEKSALADIRRRYTLYVSKFEAAAAVYSAGQKESARKMESEEIDPAERGLEHALDALEDQKRGEVNRAIDRVRSHKVYAALLPSLSPTIDNLAIIKMHNNALQHSLEGEQDYLKQVVALTDMFLFNDSKDIEEFDDDGGQFEKELLAQRSPADTLSERDELDLIARRHHDFSEAFATVAIAYKTGDRARALHLEEQTLDPAEKQLDQAITQSYPARQQQMKRALDDIVLASGISLSLTRHLVFCIALISVVGLALGGLIAIRISAPIRSLAAATERITTGDFDGALEVKSRDEVGQLTRSFNRMVKMLYSTTVSRDYVDGILGSMGDSLVVASNSGDILSINPATTMMLGYSEAELIGQPIEMLFARSGGPEHAGPRAPVAGGGAVERFYLARDGRRIPISVLGSTLRLDHQGKGLVCVATDITDRKRAEEALRKSEHKLSLHIQQTPLAVIEWNLDAEIIEWNPAAELLFGYCREEVIGRRMTAVLVPESERETVERDWDEMLSQKTGQHKTNHNLTKDGRTIICDWYNTPLDSEGRVIGVASMVQDFTDRVQMEADLHAARDLALTSARHKSDFLANMSHEIRTPMNGVIGMTGLLLDTDLNADQREFAETIRSSGDALLTIINDILDFSKIEAGKLQFEMLDFDLRNAVEGAIELLAERARLGKVELSSRIHPDLPDGLRGDPGRLRQVLINLISNAIKFSEDGDVTVIAEKGDETDNHVLVRFSVKDTGIGIAQDAQRSLFQPFIQADGSTTRKYGGTGLGLAICKQLVELMGGQIGVESVLGTGSTFWFTARFRKQLSDSEAAGPALERFTGLNGLIADDGASNQIILPHQPGSRVMIHAEADSNRRILVAEDNVVNQKVALRQLEKLGYHAEAVADGNEVLEALKHIPYDLILMDCQMPDLDGYQTTGEIRRREAGTKHILIVAMTAHALESDREKCLAAGMDGYLSKPVKMSDLSKVLNEMFAQRDHLQT